MGRFSAALMRFFAGRYGLDFFGKCQLVLYFALFVVNLFVGRYFVPGLLLLLLELAVLVWWLFRVLSRNIAARARENERLLRHTARIRRWGRLQKSRWRDRHTHVYRKCPYCRAVVRLPKTRRGRHACDCPRCHREFPVKI